MTKEGTYQVFELPDLNKFYELSLKTDNYVGLNLLLDYSKKFVIDFKNFDLNAFRPSLDYYLNTEFNLSNVCTFIRFYSRVIAQQTKFVGKPVAEKKAGDKMMKSTNIFKNAELIDMRSLFHFLVEKLGKKNLIDQSNGHEVLFNSIVGSHL